VNRLNPELQGDGRVFIHGEDDEPFVLVGRSRAGGKSTQPDTD
jgi:hypothetical protein